MDLSSMRYNKRNSWLNQVLDIKENLHFYKILSIAIFTLILKLIS